MIRKVYSVNGELNFEENGEKADLDTMNFNICMGNAPIKNELLELQEGIFMWQDGENLKKILEKDIGIEREEINDFEGEYIKVADNKKHSLKDELEKDLEVGLEELLSCKVDNLDVCLRAVTKIVFNSTIYVYNYSRDENGEIEKTQVIADVSMFQTLTQTI